MDDADDLDLEISNAVAINVAADEREIVGSAILVKRLVVQLALPSAKLLRSDEPEALVAAAGRVGVDIPEIDIIQSPLEVRDNVAAAGTDRTVCQGIEVEHIGTGTPGQRIAPQPAHQAVVAPAAAERVRRNIAGERVSEGRANDVLDATELVRVAESGNHPLAELRLTLTPAVASA